jgi:hypothetical protein
MNDSYDIRTWRFWFLKESYAKLVFKDLKMYINPDALEFIKRIDKEIRIKFKDNVLPCLGVLPASDDNFVVHFGNTEFYCNWFVYRESPYDLTFDGKPSVKNGKVSLNKMYDFMSK